MMLSVTPLLHVLLWLQSHSIEIPIFIHELGRPDLISLDIIHNITASQLHSQVPGLGIGDILSIGGNEIERTDTRQIADLSICPESVIHIIRQQPTDAVSLYHFAKDLKNKEFIPWWNLAFDCSHFPKSIQCQNQMICDWPGIQCNLNQNEENITWSVTLDTPSFHNWTPHLEGIPVALSGKLVLRLLPQTVQLFQATNSEFDDVDFRGLNHHDLQLVDLQSNVLKAIDLRDLRGSSIDLLDLDSNQIQSINLSSSIDTELRILYLRNNEIQKVDFRGLKGSKLTNVALQRNRLSDVCLEGIEESKLGILELYGNPIEKIDFKGIMDSCLRYLFLPSDTPQKMHARNVHELVGSSLQEVSIQRILSHVEEEGSDMKVD